MDPLAKAAALLLSRRLSSLQEQLESRLDSQGSGSAEDLRELNESIQQLKDRLDQIK